MTWHLKDRLLEKQLKKIIPNLNILIKEALDKQLCENYIGIQFDRRIDADVLFDCRLWFFKWELVEIKDYDPYDWHPYPNELPQSGDNYLVTVIDQSDHKTRYVGTALFLNVTGWNVSSRYRVIAWANLPEPDLRDI